jgi:hypothetical protein
MIDPAGVGLVFVYFMCLFKALRGTGGTIKKGDENYPVPRII